MRGMVFVALCVALTRSVLCEPCPVGTYSDGGDCSSCEVGKVSLSPGQSTCTLCAEGLGYVDATACEVCPLGMGVDLPGQPCLAAPGYSFWTRVREGDVIYWTYITNTPYSSIDECGIKCPVDDTILFYNKIQACHCLSSDLTFGVLQNSTISSGAVAAEGYVYNLIPQACPVDHFKEDIGWGLCEPCPANMATTGDGSVACVCGVGYYPQSSTETCELCPDGAETCVQVYLSSSPRTRSLGVFLLTAVLMHNVLQCIWL